MTMKSVTLTTDGACIGNPGPGGWAFILRYGEDSKEQRGPSGEGRTTGNRMDLFAAIEGLQALKEPCEVRLVSNSEYLTEGLSKWIHTWKADGWVRRKKNMSRPVINADLWKVLDNLASKHTITCQWKKGNSGDPDHERCIELAAAQAQAQAEAQARSQGEAVHARMNNTSAPSMRDLLDDMTAEVEIGEPVTRVKPREDVRVAAFSSSARPAWMDKRDKQRRLERERRERKKRRSATAQPAES